MTQDLTTLLAEATLARQRRLEFQETEHNAIAALRAAILQGASTGDAIKDYVLVNFPDLEPEKSQHLARLARVDSLLVGNVGRPVFGHWAPDPGKRRMAPCSFYFAGLLVEDQLRFTRTGVSMRCTLPVERYFTSSHTQMVTMGTVADGAPFGYFSATGNDVPNDLRVRHGWNTLTLLAGNEARAELERLGLGDVLQKLSADRAIA